VIYSKIRPYLKKVHFSEIDGLCSADMYPLKSTSILHRRFLYYLLLSSRFTFFVNSQSGRTGIPKVNREEISEFPALLPTLHEQNAIAKLLGTWDKAINILTQLIGQKELRKKWLMQQLLTGKKRLPRFVRGSGGKKGVEGEWVRYRYSELLKEIRRPIEWDDNELYHLISVRRKSGGIFERESLYGYQIKVKDLRNAKPGDFLFSKMQIVHGASALVTREFEGAKISGSYIAVNSRDRRKLDIEFFDWYSKTPYFYHQTYISSYGVHIEKMTFDFENFLSLDLKVPSIQEQRSIVEVLQSSSNEILLHRKKLDSLKEQKKGLMQILLTGKKRLRIQKL
jgi:type I restriction enzyme, S subunit